jgi:uncharacterized membrane protein YccC
VIGGRAAASVVAGHVGAIGRELTELRFTGHRARVCTRTALSVVLAVTLAQWASLDDVWWAAISGMMASQATRPASMQRAVLRVGGTAAGAVLGCAALALLAYDQVALCGFLFVCGTVGVLGMSVARYGYMWLFGGLTANMIVMMAMNDPSLAPGIAADRLAQVALGCLAAGLMAWLLAPPGGDPPAPEPPGWTDLLGTGWPAVTHAVRSGVTIMIMPIIWNALELPSLTQMAITVAAVMAVPVIGADPAATAGVITGRAVLRLIGCLFGGVLGLLCLALPLTLYPLWLTLLFAGIWLSAHLAASTRGVSYAGIQAAVVFIVTLVQGAGPPDSILPGIERFAGIGCGLVVLLLVGLALWPDAAPPQRSSGPLRASGYHGGPDRQSPMGGTRK